MKKTDKFLIAIVGGILLLIVVAFGLTLLKPEPSYRSETDPEGVAHNYLLALQKEEYERAYRYLSPRIKNYPESLAAFQADVLDNPWRFRSRDNSTLSVRSATITRSQAVVTIDETRFRGGGFFDSGQSTYAFEMKMHQVNGAWKITDSDYYFAWCWIRGDGCD